MRPVPARAAGPLVLAACAALAACVVVPFPGGTERPPPERPAPAEPPPGGLTPDQVATLGGLGVPVLVPGDVGAFSLAQFEASAGAASASYALVYRRPDGACFEVSGSNGGFGGPDWPLVETEARVASLGRTVRVFEAADDPAATSAQVWGVGTVVSENIALDGASALFLSDTQSGCRPVSLQEGAALVADLRLLGAGPPTTEPGPPAEVGEPLEPSAFGAFAPAPDLLEDYNAASTPRVAADAIARRYDGAAERVLVEVVGQDDREATALVTAFGLPDDSIRDERLLLTYALFGGTWELADAGRQVRCWPGRGHAEWSPEACL